VVTLATIVVLTGGIRWAAAMDPALAAAVLVGLAVAVVACGLGSMRRFHLRPWHSAWTALGLGLLGVVGSEALQLLHRGGNPMRLSAAMATGRAGQLAAAAGLVWLIHQRMPQRAAEALAETLVATLALGFVVLALIVVPSQGWHPTHSVPAIAAPLLDLVLLCLAGSLISLTERHPPAYRLFIPGFALLFAAHGAASGLSMQGHPPSFPLIDAAALAGACLWGAAFVHPSRRKSFDPVPHAATRPNGAKVAMMVSVALVVPGVLSVQSALGISTRDPALIIGSTLLPLLMVLYLLHQVFTHADAEYRAQHDPLTGACNRLLFEDRIRLAIAQADRADTAVAVMFLDLDRFKDINDSLGHAVGNELLKAVVKRLQGCLREQDTMARFGGDEFTFLVVDGGRKDVRTGRMAERILDRFGDPFNVGGRQLTVKASIGVAVYPDDGADAETLLKHADTAMYQAKAAGRNTYVIFDTAMSARARLRFALEDSLRAAVECDRMAVHYQPKLDMATGSIAGVEALARWQHPRLGFIPPWAFIPLAEETSLVGTLGEWVLEVACRQVQRWQEEGLPAVPVAVNLSPRQFTLQPVVEVVDKVLHRTGLDPELLELEVTESVLMENLGSLAEDLGALRAMGVRCSIDDFGTGYNALTYLAEIPVDGIKIDRSFVQRIDGEGSGAPIVGAVIALAHGLGLTVVAEGVETDAQLRFLDAHQCDQVQGFRFSAPVTATDLARLVGSPERMFTDWGSDLATPPPSSVVPPARQEALLHSVLQERRWHSELDTEAIETVLAALQHEEPTSSRASRRPRPRPPRRPSGPAALVPVPGGRATSPALAPVESLAAKVFHSREAPGDQGEDDAASRLGAG
jgi:diguanylate cyclase (GGDEF)-like protein